jgi:hypothetical protein
LLAALSETDAPRAVMRELVRGEQALASLARLGLDASRIAEERAAVREFARTEALDPDLVERLPRRRDDRTPVRRQRGMLDFMRHQIEGYDRLSEDERQDWRDLENATPGASTVFDLAWFACDGRRTIGDIAELIHIETGTRQCEILERFFTITERLGISAWEEACSTSAPATATH